MGKNHARVCTELDEVELAGIFDENKETARVIANRLGVAAYDSYQDLTRHVDAVIIATPTVTHYPIAEDCLSRGLHVLVEKPICDTVEHAKHLTQQANDQELVLAVGHIERHNPTVGFVKEALSANQFGDLITIASKRVSNFPGRIRDVGVILDFGVHDIDVMRYLAGEVISVYARGGQFTETIHHEDYATILLNFKNGLSGVLEMNWLTPMRIRKLFLTCSQAFVEADYMNQSVTVSSSSYKDVNEMDLYQVPISYNINEVALEKREPLKNEIADFAHAITQKKPALATGQDGMRALQIAQAATKSYHEKQEVTIE